MKLHRKADSRIPRTRAAIRNAYLGLLTEKDAAAITVTDVAAAASLDRKTIYNYYASATAILDELENELVGKVGGMLREMDFAGWLRDPFGFLDAVTRAFDAHEELTTPLVKRNKSSHVLDKLRTAVSERVGTTLSECIAPAKRQYARLYADFLTSGIVTVYREWLARGRKQPLEEIARQIQQLLDGSLSTFIG